MKRTIRGLLVVAGFLLVVHLILATGVTEIGNAMVTLSWRIALLLLVFSGITTALDTLAWRFAFDRMPRFRRLPWVRLAGEAVNATTASGCSSEAAGSAVSFIAAFCIPTRLGVLEGGYLRAASAGRAGAFMRGSAPAPGVVTVPSSSCE